jgi:NAD(P)-dependent dehydrogenase (short-subunit alcohol dehydrogenase family)
MGLLDDKVAIVTGAGHGIGHGIARRFAREGARVLVADLDGEAADGGAAENTPALGGDAAALRVDVGDKGDVQRMVATAADRWGTVHVLVNNAWGGASFAGVEDKTDANLAHGLALAYYGPFWAMQASFPFMKAQHWGRIINMCSGAGVNAQLGTLEYNAAKEALRTLTRTAAREWAGHGIVANAICPGAKGSGMLRRYAEDPELEASLDAMNPTGRVGDPETDIGPVAAFLASDDCRYLTGNTLFVDGGSHIGGGSWQPATWAKDREV